MIDTHVHLLSRQFDRDRDSVIERAFKAGNEFLVEIGTDVGTSQDAVALARAHERIYASVGVHPHDARTINDEAWKKLERLADDPRVVAIGETGLDFYRDLSPRDVQKRVFAGQIALARKKKLPLVVHIRAAYREALDILKTEKASEVGGVLHCFSGDRSAAESGIALGFKLAFGGTITYERSESRKQVADFPLACILLETDCPYLTPEPHRGKRNEPAYVALVLDAMAKLRNVDKKKIEEATSANARELFHLREGGGREPSAS